MSVVPRGRREFRQEAFIPFSELCLHQFHDSEKLLGSIRLNAQWVWSDVGHYTYMQTMWQNGLNRALSGYTTLEEILRVVAVEQI